MTRATIAATAFSLCLAVAGCTPARYVDDVRYTADRFGVRSADSLAVAGRGHLRFNLALLSDLDDALALDDADALRADGERIIDAAHVLAVNAANSEIDRMPPAALNDLIRRLELATPPDDPGDQRVLLKERFAAQSEELLAADLQTLAAARDIGALRRFLRGVRRDVEPPAGDRGKAARALLAAPLYLPAVIGAEIVDAEATQRSVTVDFEHVAVYEPPSDAAPPTAAELANADTATLAEWYAPIFVQQTDPEATYAAEDDRFGRIYLTGTPTDIAVHVDVSQPVVYWKQTQAKVGRKRYDQLIYVAWYPRRPALSDNDPQAGEIDGVVVRVTLDQRRRPAVYEFVRSCGCYHTLWVAEFVEAAARDEFGPPAKGRYAVQRSDVRQELFLPALVRDDGSAPHRSTAFISAGHHLLMDIRLQDAEPPRDTVETRQQYVLEPYDDLTRLPLGDGVASMFGSDGLVHNGGRAEGWMLAPTGMLSAGQPRQLGTMKIRMDAYDYDDPRLLERNLRLPGDF